MVIYITQYGIFSILCASSGSITICSWLILILFYNHKKEWHFRGLTQGREGHLKNIKLSWRRRTIIFIVNCKQKLIVTAKMKSRSESQNVNVFIVNMKFKLLTVR